MNHERYIAGLNNECRRDCNTESWGWLANNIDDCINKEEFPEDNSALKDAVKGKGKVVRCGKIRDNFAGNNRYVVFLDEDDGYTVYLFSVANGLYNKMGPFTTLDSALSRADCYGLFKEDKMTTKDFETILREAVGDYLYDDEDGNPVYDGGEEDWDSEGYDDGFVGVDDDAEFTDQLPIGIHNDLEDEIADTMPTRDADIFGRDTEDSTDDFAYSPNLYTPNLSNFGPAPEEVDYDPFDESKKTDKNKLQESISEKSEQEVLLAVKDLKDYIKGDGKAALNDAGSLLGIELDAVSDTLVKIDNVDELASTAWEFFSDVDDKEGMAYCEAIWDALAEFVQDKISE